MDLLRFAKDREGCRQLAHFLLSRHSCGWWGLNAGLDVSFVPHVEHFVLGLYVSFFRLIYHRYETILQEVHVSLGKGASLGYWW